MIRKSKLPPIFIFFFFRSYGRILELPPLFMFRRHRQKGNTIFQFKYWLQIIHDLSRTIFRICKKKTRLHTHKCVRYLQSPCMKQFQLQFLPLHRIFSTWIWKLFFVFLFLEYLNNVPSHTIFFRTSLFLNIKSLNTLVVGQQQQKVGWFL